MKFVVNGKEFDNLEEAQKFEEELKTKDQVDIKKRCAEIDEELKMLRLEHQRHVKIIHEIVKKSNELMDERLEIAGPVEALDLLFNLIKEELE